MNRERSMAAAQAEAASQPEHPSDGAAASTAGTAALGAEGWVIATDQTALLPLIRGPRIWPEVVLTSPVILAGVVAWVVQMVEGLGITGMTNQAPWSLYIVNFVFFIGASAGGIVIAGLVYALKIDRFRPVARLAEITALTCLTLAALFITFDMGRPERIWHLLAYGSVRSPLVWDVASITTYGVLAFALVYFSLRADLVRLAAEIPKRRALYRALALGSMDLSHEKMQRDKRLLRALAIAAVPAAVAVHTVTAWILGVVKAQPGWHSSVLAPMFITSAVTSGVALTIVAAVVSRAWLHVRIDENVIRGLARILFFAVPVLGYMQLSELVTAIYQREPEGVHVFTEMMSGRYAPLFWFTLAGQIVPFVLLAYAKRLSMAAIAATSMMVVLAVLAERWNIVLPTLTGRSHLPFEMFGYTPTVPELVITAAAYAGGILVYVFLSRILPLIDLTVEREAAR